jgi:hypothetical protein
MMPIEDRKLFVRPLTCKIEMQKFDFIGKHYDNANKISLLHDSRLKWIWLLSS